MSVKINSPKDCLDGNKAINFAKSNGCNIRNGKGDHVIVEYKGKQEVIPSRDVGFGLACKIFKFFKSCGLLGFGFCIVYYFVDLGINIPFLPHM